MSHEKNDRRQNRFLLVIAAIAFLAFGFVIVGANDADGAESSSSTCVPTPAIPEVPGTPEVPAVTHEEQVFDHWQRYSWTGGPWESDVAPPFPSENWQPNVQGDPHGIGVEGAYFVSHGNSGNGDWFYLEAVETTIVVVDVEAIPAVPGTPAVPEVVCPEPTTPGVDTLDLLPEPEPSIVICGIKIDPPKPGEPTMRDILCPLDDPKPEKADKPKAESKSDKSKRPTKPSSSVACVNGTWVTTVNNKVVATSGTCGEGSSSFTVLDEVDEEGL